MNIKEYMEGSVLGNIRTGIRDQDDKPKKFNYFNVHIDKTTSSLAVELFNQAYDKPKRLKIRFISQNPLDVNLERYEGRKRRCYGNNKQAKFIDDKGKTQIIECNCKTCQYKDNKSCKFVGRLYFLLDKLENEGIWCYPIGSEKGIKRIAARIARANRIGEDLTKDWYELFLIEEDAPTKGKNYIPDIIKLKDIQNGIDLKNTNQEESNDNKSPKNNQAVNYLKLIGFQMTIYENQKVLKVKFIDTSSKEQELILLSKSKQDITNLAPGTIISPISISKRDNISILNDYKIIKEVKNTSLNEMEKAV